MGQTQFSSLPLDDIALPLREHLLQATKDKILHRKYIDLFSLLYWELEKKDKDLIDDRKKEIWKKRKVDKTWGNLFSGYSISVIARLHPWKSARLFQYLDIVYTVYRSFLGGVWLQYDKQFCMHAATNSALPWDQVR